MGTVLHHQFYRWAKKSATATSRSLGSHFLMQVQQFFKQELILVVYKIVKRILKEDHAFRCRWKWIQFQDTPQPANIGKD
jgi:hypothetical protein